MERQPAPQKKPYAPPTVTEQGDAVKETRGMGGKYMESFSERMWSDFEDLPADD
jgi:hypothetical protein